METKRLLWGVWYADAYVDQAPEFVGTRSQCAEHVEGAVDMGAGDPNLYLIAEYNEAGGMADEWLSMAEHGEMLDARYEWESQNA